MERFSGKVIEHKMFMIFPITLSEISVILKRILRDVVIHVHVKYLLFLSDFNESLIFSTDFRKIFAYKISRKSVQWEPSCSMRTDGLTDRHRHDEAHSHSSQFCERA